MLLFDISDTSIEVVRLGKSFITGEVINASAREELKSGLVRKGEIRDREGLKRVITDLLKSMKPKAVKDRECGFTLPDKRVYAYRFRLPQRRDSQTVFELVKAQAEKAIPQPIEELIYRFDSIDRGKGEGEIFLMAVPTAIVNRYVELFNDLGLQPRLIVPESLAAYTFLAPAIRTDETVLYLDMGKSLSNAVLMDKQGVVVAFSEPVQTDKLFSQVSELFKFSRERLGKEVSRVILGGGESLNIDIADAKDKLKIEVVSIEATFERFRLPIRTDFEGISRIVFVNVFGLALLSKEQSPLNLLP